MLSYVVFNMDISPFFFNLRFWNDIPFTNAWYSNDITNNGKTVFLKRWYKTGIYCIGHFLNEEEGLMNYDEFCACYLTPMFIEFWGLMTSIRTYLNMKTY